jgi:paraquat-inducible protein B
MTTASLAVSVRIAHLDSSKAKGQRHHDTRKRCPEYVDKERTEKNSTIVDPMMEAELRKQCEERRAQRSTKRAMKSNAAVATVGIITFGKGAQKIIEKLPIDEQNRLFSETAKRIAERLDTDLTGLIVHRDESAIHAHFQMLAVAKDGRPISQIVKRDLAKELQDIAGQVYESYGIYRGTPKAERIARGEDASKTTHRSVKQLYEDMPKELAAFDKKIDEAEKELMFNYEKIKEQEDKIKKNERLIQEQLKKLEEGKVELEKAQKRIEIYKRRAEAAGVELEALTKSDEDFSMPYILHDDDVNYGEREQVIDHANNMQ